MIAGLIGRLVLFSIIVLGVTGFDLYQYVNKNALQYESEEGETVTRSLTEALKYVAQNRSEQTERGRVPIKGKFYPIFLDEEGYRVISFGGNNFYIYDDEESGDEYVGVDGNGIPTDEEEEDQAVAKTFTHQASFLQDSYAMKFYIPHIFGLLYILLALKDIGAAIKDKSGAAPTSKKAREKAGRKLLANLESYVKKGKHRKIIETMTNPNTRELIPREMDKLDLELGRAYLEVGEKEKAVPVLKRYCNKFKDDEEGKVLLGEYFAENQSAARIQDLPYLLAYLDEREDDKEFMQFFAGMVMKHNANDRGTVRGLCKICALGVGGADLREYVLTALVQFEEMDEIALEFYESCKSAEPENPKPVLMLAEGKLAAGRFNEALDELELLMNMDYENQRVHDMLFTIYQLKESLNELYAIYGSILEDYPDEAIATAQQRRIAGDPTFNQELADADSKLSLQELLAKRKDGDSSADNSIMKKYEKTLTIMFTDIKGYTQMTESQSIVETMAILQESDDILPPIIAKHEGVVIKKIGDAFMARFDTADSAIMAGVQIQQAIYQNNQRREGEDKIAWRIRVGLNTGSVIVKDGDVFGDAVNVASRVESNSEADCVFCTEDTVKATSNQKIKFEEKASKKVKGKTEEIKLFSVIFDNAGSGV